MGAVLSAIQRIFWAQEMEIAVLGLQGAGKSTFVHVINTGSFSDGLMPTVGFNMHKVQRGAVTIKVWDMGGQEKFRSMWERYCRGVQCIVFVLDASTPQLFTTANTELHSLLLQPSLQSTPLLLLYNKCDLATAVSADECNRVLGVDSMRDKREIGWYRVSCKRVEGIDKTLEWIMKHAKSKK